MYAENGLHLHCFGHLQKKSMLLQQKGFGVGNPLPIRVEIPVRCRFYFLINTLTMALEIPWAPLKFPITSLGVCMIIFWNHTL